MGFEINVKYHPKKTEGIGYDPEKLDSEVKQVGKAFEETGLEKLAAAIMFQLARRDVMVVDLEIVELVRKTVTFKEAKDGRGIILNGKKFSLDATAQMVAEDVVEVEPQYHVSVPNGHANVPAQLPADITQQLPPNMQPHELMAMQRQSSNLDDLYSNPNKPLAVRRQNPIVKPKVDPRKVLYHVYFTPYIHQAEAKNRKLKFVEDKKYPVHGLRENPLGGQFGNLLTVTDDSGKQVEVDEKFFEAAGNGLMGDNEVQFSTPKRPPGRKLMYEDQMLDVPQVYREEMVDVSQTGIPRVGRGQRMDRSQIPEEFRNIPVEGEESFDAEIFEVPDLRPGKKF